MNKYSDLHRTYDFRPWESGFRKVCPDVHIFDYYASFVSIGPLSMEGSIRDLVQKHNIQLLIVPHLYFEIIKRL